MPQTGTEWTSLYLAQRARLQTYALALTGNEADAADLLQDVLLRLVRQNPPADQPRAYLMRALRNAAIDRFRQRSDAAGVLDPDVLAAVDTDAVAAADELAALRSGLERVRDDYREILVLKTHCDLTFAEIAEITALPPGTVASHYRRGLEQLRELLTENDDDKRTTRTDAGRPANPPSAR